jgi:hypothetical protein
MEDKGAAEIALLCQDADFHRGSRWSLVVGCWPLVVGRKTSDLILVDSVGRDPNHKQSQPVALSL